MINWPSFPVETDAFYFPNQPQEAFAFSLLASQNTMKRIVLIPPALPNANMVEVLDVSKRP